MSKSRALATHMAAWAKSTGHLSEIEWTLCEMSTDQLIHKWISCETHVCSILCADVSHGNVPLGKTATFTRGAHSVEARIKCQLCRSKRASGLWQLGEQHFGRITIRAMSLCAACGFDAVNKRRVIWRPKDNEPLVVRRFMSCTLLLSYNTATVKPPEAVSVYKNITRKSTVPKLRFITDPDYVQHLDDWREV